MVLLVASAAFPVRVIRKDNSFEYEKVGGGLVSAVESLNENINFIWFGEILNDNISPEEELAIEDSCLKKFKCIPVFFDKNIDKLSVQRFCDCTLWSALHSFPDNVCFVYQEYNAYVEYNKQFASKLLLEAKENDIIWVHDYHLMLTPKFLKQKNPSVKIGFFLHIPFPEPENLKGIFSIKEIISAVSKADVVAFQTPGDAVNFRCALHFFGIKYNCKIKPISIGIFPENFRGLLNSNQNQIEEIRNKYKNKKIVLGIDRTDYIKGLPQKLTGIEYFFEKNPEEIEKTVFIELLIPSRLFAREYCAYVNQINYQIQKINGKFGDINTTVVKAMMDTVSNDYLVALYGASDALLVTSITDGLNLVSLEYIACQDSRKGVVILSDFVGVGPSLPGAVFHNPHRTDEICSALERALKAKEDERSTWHSKNRITVEKFTSTGWAKKNLKEIDENWEILSENNRKNFK